MLPNTAKVKPTAIVPAHFVNMCFGYGTDIVSEYAKRRATECVIGYQDIGKDPVAQANAKAAECALAAYLGLDLYEAVDWSTDAPDPGWDIRHGGIRIDVKGALPRSSYLIWSLKKLHLLERKEFDVFVLVKGEKIIGDKDANFEITGWISKAAFMVQSEIAGPGHRLHEGTRYLHQGALHDFPIA